MSDILYEYFFTQELTLENIEAKRISSIIPRAREIHGIINALDNVRSNALFVDVGCGSAFFIHLLAQTAKEQQKEHIFVGIDPNAKLLAEAAAFYGLREIAPQVYRKDNFILAVGSAINVSGTLKRLNLCENRDLSNLKQSVQVAQKAYVKAYTELAQQPLVTNHVQKLQQSLLAKKIDCTESVTRLLVNTVLAKQDAGVQAVLYAQLLEALVEYEQGLAQLNYGLSLDMLCVSWLPYGVDFTYELLALTPKIFLQVKDAEATGVTAAQFFPAHNMQIPDAYYVAQNVFRPSYSETALYQLSSHWSGTGHKRADIEYLFFALPEYQAQVVTVAAPEYSWEKFIN